MAHFLKKPTDLQQPKVFIEEEGYKLMEFGPNIKNLKNVSPLFALLIWDL